MSKKLRSLGIVATLLLVAVLATSLVSAADVETERMRLAQQYKNAEPGENFVLGHITFHLSQEYAMMVYQAIEQACNQLGLTFRGALAETDAAWIEQTQSMIAAGAKAIIYNCPSVSVIPELARICNENNVHMATLFGITGEVFPGDFGPYWVVDNTPLSDLQTYFPLMVLFEKMEQNGKNKLLHIQASRTNATVSTVLINLGVFQAWQHYPEMQVLGHQYGEWDYENGRRAAEAAIAIRQDYEGLWGSNDSVTTGAKLALEDRGIAIGPFTASRDMEMTTAEEILDGNFLVTAGFAIPYYGGRMVPMLYDMCVGAWYPLEEEMIQTGAIDVYGRPGEIEELAKAAGLDEHPNFRLGPLEDNLNQILLQMTAREPNYPYDFRLLSYSKCEELGLEFDRHAGGGTVLGSHDFFYPAALEKFGSVEAYKKHIVALMEHFIDFSVDTYEELMEFAETLPPEIKTEPIWK